VPFDVLTLYRYSYIIFWVNWLLDIIVANKRKILVTGATGQQGGALARLLLQKKHEVYALIRSTKSESPKAQNLKNQGAKLVEADLDKPDSLEKATNGIDSVFLMGTWTEVGTEGEIRRGKWWWT